MRYYVTSFGADCLGNVTGWRVVEVKSRAVMGQFVGDLYVVGSHAEAKRKAFEMAERLEADHGA